MNKKGFGVVGIIFFLFILSSVAQNTPKTELIESLSKDLEGQELPGALGMLFGDNQINVHLTTAEGVVVVGVVTEDNTVKSLSPGEVEDPSLNFYLDEAALMQIQKSEEPLASLQKALDGGQIKYKPVGLLNKIKFAFLSVFSNITSLFISDEKDSDAEELHKEEIVEAAKADEVTAPVVEEEEDTNAEQETSETEAQETSKNQLTGEVVSEIAEKVTETEKAEHTVFLTEKGFEPAEITIAVGDTVTWENLREGKINQGMVIGVRQCRDVKSGLLKSGQSYSFTFTEKGTCVIVDGILTTTQSEIDVE